MTRPLTAAEELRAGLDALPLDYMTSGSHHPGYVLIPEETFRLLTQSHASTTLPAPQPAPQNQPEPDGHLWSTVMLASGKYYDYQRPHLNPPTPEDCANALGNLCRFAGHTVSSLTGMPCFYSVAQHCVLMSRAIPAPHKYAALTHELGEVVCVDVPGPLKGLCPDYKALEKLCGAAIAQHYHATPPDQAIIKQYDHRLLATEQRDLMLRAAAHTWEFTYGAQPLPQRIRPWGPRRAAREWLTAYQRLRPQDAPQVLAA